MLSPSASWVPGGPHSPGPSTPTRMRPQVLSSNSSSVAWSASTWPSTYVSTPGELATLLGAIHTLPHPPSTALIQRRLLYFDTEGYELGTTIGRLSMIQLGLPAPDASHGVAVYLVDVLALASPGSTILRGLWDVLEDESFLKCAWDAKQDFAELYHGHGVALRGVLDLQIAELLGRVRGADLDKREGKMSSVDRSGWVWGLGGMKRAVDDFEAFSSKERDEAEQLFLAVRAKFDSGGSSAWLDRPLTPEFLTYAALDIYKLSALQNLFHHPRSTRPFTVLSHVVRTDDPLIASSNLDQILSVSDRSLRVHEPERRAADDPYHQHAYLPSEVLEVGEGELREVPCPGCKRLLRESSWAMSLSRVCKVCWAVERRLAKKRGQDRGVFSPGRM